MIKKLSILAIISGSIATFTSTSMNARLGEPEKFTETNPAAQIQAQIQSIDSQIALIQTSLLNVPRNSVTGPKILKEVSEVIEPILENFDSDSYAIENVMASSLQEYEGQYKNAALPNSLSNDYLSKLPQPRGNQEFNCLAEALYFEARGENLQGQRAVAEVILNRVASKRYPDTICGVVNQGTGKKHRCQFSYTCDGIPEVVNEPNAYTRGAKIARLMIDGLYENDQITGGALFYHTTGVNPSWASAMIRTSQFGVHLFYRQ